MFASDLTPETLKEWCGERKPLVLALLRARAFAKVERERVDAYEGPIFRRFTFFNDKGIKIADKNHLFACPDEEHVAAYYRACLDAHAKHGWKGDVEACPALTAEYAVTQAEWALLDLACPLFNLKDHPYGPNRAKFLDLLIRACLNA